MRDSDSNKLRPLDAFVKYFLDVKPSHTKLLEVVERYRFAEKMQVDIADIMFASIEYRNNPLCRVVGFGLVFDDCGFSNDNCCDLFQCLSGYGLIWDNSDLIGTHVIRSIDYGTDELIIDGDYSFDKRLEILSVDIDSLLLRGEHADAFITQKLFLIAPFNVYQVESASGQSITVTGDVAIELTAKREFRLRGSAGRDGLYGVASAAYNAAEDVTVITVATNLGFDVNVSAASIETESQSKNQGFYQVERTKLTGGNTRVFIKSGTVFPDFSMSNNGSVQLRTAISAPRHIWLSGGETEREYRVADAFYDVTNDRTHIILADQLFSGEVYNELRLYGYMTSAGFDGDEECDQPKPTNIHAVIGESLKISVLRYYPEIISAPNISAIERENYSYDITSTDSMNRPRVLSISSGPSWLDILDNGDGTGRLYGKPPLDSESSIQVVLRVTNSIGVWGEQSFTVNVTNIIPDVILASAGDTQTQICNPHVDLSPTILGFGIDGEFAEHTYLWEQHDDSPELITIVNADTLQAWYNGSREHTIRFWLDKGTAKEQYKDVEINKTPVSITAFPKTVKVDSGNGIGVILASIVNLPVSVNTATSVGKPFAPHLQWSYTLLEKSAKVSYYIIQQQTGAEWSDYRTLINTETFTPVESGYAYRVVAVIERGTGMLSYRLASEPVHVITDNWVGLPSMVGYSVAHFASADLQQPPGITNLTVITRSLNTLADNTSETLFHCEIPSQETSITGFSLIVRYLVTLPDNVSATTFSANFGLVASNIQNYTVTNQSAVIIGQIGEI